MSSMAGLGAFISPGRSLEPAIERVRLAESLGYRAIYVTHVAARDSLGVLAAYAARTERIGLGTGVLPIHSRSPVATAQAAATVDELSGGRMILGLGSSHRSTNEAWYGQRSGDSVAEMREYATTVRAILGGQDPPGDEERRWPTSFRFRGFRARPELPIHIAALEPAMLELAGEIADGALLWLCAPDYVREVVIPAVRTGRERAGRTLAGFEVVAAVPALATADREGALQRVRSELAGYLALPSFRSLLERSGFGAEIAAFDAAIASGDVERARAAVGESMLDSIGGFGAPGAVRAAIARYVAAGVTSPCLSPVGGEGNEVDATLAAGAGPIEPTEEVEGA